MGGNALKTKTVRLAKADYYPLEKQVVDKLSAAFTNRKINAIPTYRRKDSFGDMDILLENDNLPSDWMEIVRSTFSPLEIVENGPVLSFDVNQFQIDLILTPAHVYSFALSYYSWGDLGNLISLLANGIGYSFGHEGLSYRLYEGTQLISTIKLSTDFRESLIFLGFEPDQHTQGFNEIADIFKFVVSSTYFRPESFNFDNLNNTARVRLKKRPLYGAFLAFLEENKQPSQEKNKETHLQRGFKFFDEFQSLYAGAEQWKINQRIIKSKFNGDIVSHLTGLTRRELGDFMAGIRNSFATKNDFECFIIKSSQDEINAYMTGKSTCPST